MSEYRPGLEGVVAARTAISEVDGQNGRLIYRGGYLIQDLAETCSYEEVIHLLWTGELPTAAQLAAFSADLAARRGLKPAARGMADLLPAESDPMDAIRSILSAQGGWNSAAQAQPRRSQGLHGGAGHRRGRVLPPLPPVASGRTEA